MNYNTEQSEAIGALNTAHKMVTAARTAPKGCGVDKIVTRILDGEEKSGLTKEMRKLSKLPGIAFCGRDADNIDASHCIVLIAVRNIPLGFNSCGFCGFDNCADATKAGSLCAFNTTDLGIAIGSAVSVAADNRVDNRVMFSAGKAAIELGLMGEDVTICYGIPLSTYAKNIFFDR